MANDDARRRGVDFKVGGEHGRWRGRSWHCGGVGEGRRRRRRFAPDGSDACKVAIKVVPMPHRPLRSCDLCDLLEKESNSTILLGQLSFGCEKAGLVGPNSGSKVVMDAKAL